MQSRLDFYSASPAAIQAMIAFDTAVKALALEPRLVELVKLRASQLNGCAYCVDLHSRDAKRQGDTDRRLHALAVWRESPFFSERERAALAWTESLTRLFETHAPDADYAWLSEHFDERERVDLTLVINAINSWNRLAVGFRKLPPG
jgi:AhpD family alkylhydroperoxidase